MALATKRIGLKKIGIFGGTFDPIHHGHLVLGRDALEQLQLDNVIFIPAAISPHKLGQKPAAAEVRVEMLRAAIEGERHFCLDGLELERAAPSYTVDTIEALKTREPDAEFVYLIGEDNVAQLTTYIRNRVARGQSIRYLVPPAVEKIIRERQLYREP
jgi:nicotinate-nucleotide adenylyltransferase